MRIVRESLSMLRLEPDVLNKKYVSCTASKHNRIISAMTMEMANQLSPTSGAPKVEEWNNFKSPLSGMDRYGDQRLELAVLMRDTVLNQLGFPWTIENGNLLGAWRSGKFIPHDDDFDVAIFFEKDAKSQLQSVFEKIKALLPPPYDARIISSYCDKIEVFDPTYGNYILRGPQYKGANYHHVTLDIQAYERFGDMYRSLYSIHPSHIYYKDLFPLGSITLEGEVFQAPFNVESVLKSIYGSLSTKAKYNKELGKYIDPEESEALVST